VPSGTAVLDWTVPDEWNVREAWIEDPDGRRIVDRADHPLHVLGYSTPVRARMSFEELRAHLFSLPDRPEWIPYRTSYYNPNWGFCLPHRQLERLAGEQLAEENSTDGQRAGRLYEVCIDAELAPGTLTYGELVLPGETDEEFLVTTHTCHPAMANDNASGMALAVRLARDLAAQPHRLTYRFLFIPGTIGSITWLARNADVVPRIAAGLVLTGLGDAGAPTYKRSRQGDAVVDRAAAKVLADSGAAHTVVDFSPYGYDERQFCSPGYDLPVGRFGRSQHGEYPQYHTSADDLTFVRPEYLADSYRLLHQIVTVVDGNWLPRSTSPFGEPQLGRRGLYRAIGATLDRRAAEMALLWVLNLADGRHTLLDMAVRSGLDFPQVAQAAASLRDAGLLVTAADAHPHHG
jgi:aminopeptidase-like protein